MIKVSSNFQIVIPLKVRQHLRIEPGQKMHVIAYNNMMMLIPIRTIQEARGSLKGIKTNIERDDQDRV